MKKSVLFILIVFSFLLISCSSNSDDHNSDDHVHTKESRWSFDETRHWHDVTCEHRGEIIYDASDHDWFENNEGVLMCAVCGYKQHEHTIDDKWSFDEKRHWHDATCEHRGRVIFDEGSHILTEDDYGLSTCSICDYKKQREFDVEIRYGNHPVDSSNPVVFEIYKYEKLHIFAHDKFGGDVKLVADDPTICYTTKYDIKGLEVGSTVLYPYYKSLKIDYPIYVNVIEFSVDTSTNNIDDVNTLNKLNENYIINANYYSVDIKGKDTIQEEYMVDYVYQVRKEPYYYYRRFYHEAGDTITIYKEEDGFKYYHYAVSFHEDGEINISRMMEREQSLQPESYYPTGYFDFSFDNMEVERDGNKYKIKGYARDLSADMRKYINRIFKYSYDFGYFTGTLEIENNVISYSYIFWYIGTDDKRLSCEFSYVIDLNPIEEYDLSDFYNKVPTSIYEVTKTTNIGEDIDIFDGDYTYCKSYFEKGIYYLDVSLGGEKIDYSRYSFSACDSNYAELLNTNRVFSYPWNPLGMMFEIKEDGYYYYRIIPSHNENETIRISKYEDDFHDELKLGNNIGTIRSTFDFYLFKNEAEQTTKYKITNNKEESIYIVCPSGFAEIEGKSSKEIGLAGNIDNAYNANIYIISPFSGVEDSYSFDINIEMIN